MGCFGVLLHGEERRTGSSSLFLLYFQGFTAFREGVGRVRAYLDGNFLVRLYLELPGCEVVGEAGRIKDELTGLK